MTRLTIRRSISGLAAALLSSLFVASAQQIPLEDVVRNLRNTDPKVRLSAVRLLREARHTDAIVPMAHLVKDPVLEVRAETIAAEVSFYLVEDIPSTRRMAFFLERRAEGQAARAFELGRLAVWPRPVPPELTAALLDAIDDQEKTIRVEAIYALGVVSQASLGEQDAARLIKALEHPDAEVRAASARVIGRLDVRSAGDALIDAINDSDEAVRHAAMRALGDLKEPKAVQALSDQLTYHGSGKGARCALDALARIGHASSVPLFTARLEDTDPHLRRAAVEGLRRAGSPADLMALQMESQDEDPMVRAAIAFAVQRHDRIYVTRLVDWLETDNMQPQIKDYLLELGPAVVPDLLPRLQEPDELLRMGVAEVLGELGDESTVAALRPLTQDTDRDVARTAGRAIERIAARGK